MSIHTRTAVAEAGFYHKMQHKAFEDWCGCIVLLARCHSYHLTQQTDYELATVQRSRWKLSLVINIKLSPRTNINGLKSYRKTSKPQRRIVEMHVSPIMALTHLYIYDLWPLTSDLENFSAISTTRWIFVASFTEIRSLSEETLCPVKRHYLLSYLS